MSSDQHLKWKLLSRSPGKPSPYRKLEDAEFELPNGCKTTYTLIKDPEIVTVFALTSERKVILVRQFRPGPMEIFDELPGGIVDEGETPEESALRELLEETGYQPGEMIALSANYEDPYRTLKRYSYLALNCKKITEPNLDPTEILQNTLMELDDFFELVKNGRCIQNATAWSAFYYLGFLKKT